MTGVSKLRPDFNMTNTSVEILNCEDKRNATFKCSREFKRVCSCFRV